MRLLQFSQNSPTANTKAAKATEEVTNGEMILDSVALTKSVKAPRAESDYLTLELAL